MRAIATEFRDRRQREERKHRLNREISAPEIRLMGPDNEALGIVPLQEALRAAGELDVDLVEIAATASPPVCRLMDYGIAPPEPAGGPRQCPHCGGGNLEKISQFGSTPCKASWVCNACLEPFDYFKCH